MPTVQRLRAWLLLLAAPLACSSSNTPDTVSQAVVTDTLGYRFDVFCDSNLCGLSPLDSDLTPKSCAGGSGSDYFILVPDPLLSIFAVRQSASGQIAISPANPARPVMCATDADCVPSGVPSGYGTLSFACTHGLCRCTSSACATADGNLLTYDVITLCQADIPWPSACPYVTTELYARRLVDVAVACGAHDTCATVPASCRQLGGAASLPIDSGLATMPGVDAGS